MKNNKPIVTWASVHKWIGLPASILILVFCVSGIILNHRTAFSDCSVSRAWLPSDYHIKDYNNGVLKGTLPLEAGRIVAWGGTGVWLTDTALTAYADFNAGLPKGSDNRNIRNMVRMADGSLWCAAQFGVYRHDGHQWLEVDLPGGGERLADITLAPDSASTVALSRSTVYRISPTGEAEAIELKAPEGYEPRVSLFKTMWMLHSGELFGMAGRIVVDAVALVLIFLCVTGIILFILPYTVRHAVAQKLHRRAAALKWNLRWHDKAGFLTAVFTIAIAFTGMCLRPPLMIPCVLTEVAPLPGSALDSPNAWHDKLRAVRWDAQAGEWLLSTSEGFYRVDRDFARAPRPAETPVPPVSPMGITVFESEGPGRWLVGSFSGLYRWDTTAAADSLSVVDYFTGRPYERAASGRPLSGHLVAGYSANLGAKGPVAFDYSAGSGLAMEMPAEIGEQPMSLWNVALELHVGRCYSPLIGPFSSLFVFLSGLILITVLVSGLVIHFRHKSKKTS